MARADTVRQHEHVHLFIRFSRLQRLLSFITV